MTILDIDIMSVTMLDKDGNGYIAKVSEDIYPILVTYLKFTPVEGVNKIALKNIVKMENTIFDKQSEGRDKETAR